MRCVVRLAVVAVASAACGGRGAAAPTARDGLAPRENAAFCGAGARATPSGCVPVPCGEDGSVDFATGACVTAEAMRTIAEQQGTTLYENEALACPEDQRLLASGPNALCVAPDVLCLRGTRWVAHARSCVPWDPCDEGAIRDPAKGSCVRIVTAGEKTDRATLVVDVGAWTRLVYGSDGGAGSSDLCGAISRTPDAFGLAVQGSAVLTIALDLTFPNNDVSQITLRVRATSDSGTTTSSNAVAALDSAASPLLLTLGQLGGTASAAATHATVRCTVKNHARPHPAPLPSRGKEGGKKAAPAPSS